MTAEELDALLQQARLPGSQYNFHRLLNPEERNAISRVLLPEIQKRIKTENAA